MSGSGFNGAAPQVSPPQTIPAGFGPAPVQTGIPLSGGLQQMAMLQAFRRGTPLDQLQAMNPYTPRQAQYLPTQVFGSTGMAPHAGYGRHVGGLYIPSADSGVGVGAGGPGDGSGIGSGGAPTGQNGEGIGTAAGAVASDAIGGDGSGGGGK